VRPRAGVDLDGVLYAWEPQARSVLESQWGVSLSPSTDYYSIHYELAERLGPAVGTDAERWLFSTGGCNAGLWIDGASVPKAVETVQRLALSHDVVLITKRPRVAIPDTWRWLVSQGVFATELVVSNKPKSSVSCDWYVDDSPSVVEELAAAGRKVYLFDCPWNQDCPAGVRVKGWDDLWSRVVKWGS